MGTEVLVVVAPPLPLVRAPRVEDVLRGLPRVIVDTVALPAHEVLGHLVRARASARVRGRGRARVRVWV